MLLIFFISNISISAAVKIQNVNYTETESEEEEELNSCLEDELISSINHAKSGGYDAPPASLLQSNFTRFLDQNRSKNEPKSGELSNQHLAFYITYCSLIYYA